MHACPSDEIVCEQRSRRWHHLRAGRFTASRFRVIMNGTTQSIERALQEVRYPKPPRDEINAPPLIWGRKYEDVGLAEYKLVTGYNARKCGIFVHKTLPVAGSPDAIVGYQLARGGCEIKCPYKPEIHLMTRELGMPRDHMHQVQGCMWLTGAEWWDFISFDPRQKDPNLRIFIQRIERDHDYIFTLEERIRHLSKFVENDEPYYEPERNVESMLLSDEEIKLF